MSRDEEGTLHAPAIAHEFANAQLGDRRLSIRLVKLAETLAAAPGKSIPQATGRRCDEDAAYRFLSNDAVRPAAILEPHFQQTSRRAAEAGTVIVAHDTTEFGFGGTSRRLGLGRLRTEKDQGFLAHVSLAVTADGARRPLGLLGLDCWARREPPNGRRNGKKRSGGDYAKQADKE